MAMLKKRMRPDETPGPVDHFDQEAGAPTSSQVQLVRRLMEESTPPSGTYIGGRVLMDTLVDGVRCRLIREQFTATPITLSPREREIARMISRGLPNKSIAQALEISVWTVGTYLRRIFSKLGVTSRAAMVAKIMEIGVLDQEPGEPTPPPLRTTDIRDEVRSTSTSKVRTAPWR
jgi:DNA-binding CsgD family transcriptional regulator